MDSPPECVLALSCERSPPPPTLPSLDHSPRGPSSPLPLTHLSPLTISPVAPALHTPDPSSSSPHSPDPATPYFPLSPFPTIHDEEDEEEEEEEELDDGVPPSPTPAVALFPGGGGGLLPEVAGCSPGPESSPPPLLGFGALELALASGPTGGGCNDELDLQLFQRDGVVAGATAAGGGGGGGGTPSVGGGTPALRFPCHVCGKRFRFQSILSLHARAHSLDRDRRASALYRTALPLQQHLKAQPNRKDPNLNLKQQRPLVLSLIQQHLREEEEEGDGGTRADQHHTFILDESNPLTPPLTEDPPVSLASPYPTPGAPSGAGGEAGSVLSAPAFRCHACKGKFRTASELARHVRILHNPYKCTLCPFSASQEERLACHLQECHPSPDAPPVPPAYTSRPVVVVAVAPDTPVATPPVPVPVPVPVVPQPATAPPAAGGGGVAPTLPAFRCETCGQRFTQSWFLKGHMRKHKDSLDHKCQVCGRGFKEPWFLKNHMKVHLNKLGLKAGLGALGGLVGADPQAKGPVSNQSLNALYSSLLLAQRGGGGGGGGGRGGRGRSERDSGSRGGLGPSKAALLSYLGLPSEGGGASCMERLQAVAQVAEMGNGGGVGGGGGGSGGAGDPGRGGGGSRGGDVTSSLADGGDQAAMWQLVARSLVAAQQAQHQQQQQQQQQRSQQQQQHRAAAAAAAQQGQRGPGRGSVIGEADQVRAYLGALDPREEAVISGGGAGGGPWECPDCGKLFRSLQQVVVHARVHTQRHGHKGGGGGGGGGGEEEESAGASRSGAGGGRAGGGCEGRQEAKLLGGGTTQQAARFHSIISTFQGENDLTAVTSGPSTPGRERVRGSGVKDCPYCGKAFRSSHHLKVHLRVHTGERPYKCPHCDYAGTQSGSLKYHLQRHHREQRNALSASSSSSSSSSSTTSSTSLTSAINSLVSGGSGQAKQRRSQMLSHGPVSRGPAESPLSRHGQQPWLLGLPDHKALATLRDVDLESQYRYLSGVMGALYQGGMEGGWIRESPPPKAPKVSRRKPLTTSRMVQPSNGSANEGSAPSAQAVGGFEPLDLSRRPSPGLGGPEEDGAMSVADVAGGGGSGLGAGAGDSMVGVTLSQCLFCPFRTASSELMAMHLQVNHTSKSRRKRGSSVALDDDAPPKAPQLRADVADPDPLAVWRYVTQSEDQVPLAEWASSRSQTLNGLLEDAGEQRERDLNRRASVRVASAASTNARGGLAPEAKMDEDEELEEEEEDDEEEEEEEELEMMGENGSLEDGLRMPLSLSPALSSDHMAMEEDRLLAD